MKLERYRAELDALRFSDEQKEHMIDRLMAAQEAAPIRRPLRLHRVPLLAALLAALLLLTAGGFAVKLVSDWFAPHYGDQHGAVIDTLGTLIGTHDSDDGITISADAIIGDRHRIRIACTVSRNNGEALTEEMFFKEFGGPEYGLQIKTGAYDASNRTSSSGSSQIRFADTDPNDDHFQMYLLSDTSRKITGDVCELVIWTADPSLPRDEQVRTAEWSMKFDYMFVDHTVDLADERTFPTEMGEVMLDILEVSPFGIYFEGHPVDRIHAQDVRDRWIELHPDVPFEKSKATDQSLYMPTDVVLHRKDGTSEEVKWSARSNGMESNYITYFQTRWDFEELILMEDIASITINGVTVELPQNNVLNFPLPINSVAENFFENFFEKISQKMSYSALCRHDIYRRVKKETRANIWFRSRSYFLSSSIETFSPN